MSERVAEVVAWLRTHDTLAWWLAAGSVVTFLGTPLLVAGVVARLPADYFLASRRPLPSPGHPLLAVIVRIGRNAVGWVVVLAGVAMLVLPGQGLLTILLGLVLVDLPGKFAVERWLVSRPRVRTAIDWIRRRAGREPLQLQGDAPTTRVESGHEVRERSGS